MKKNWTMRVGVALVALTLITSCFVGGTFAKYTTAGTGTDSARVAKFGVTVTANGNMFTDKYDTADDSATVVGQGGVKVVAPGTRGNMASMTLLGVPEVDVKVTYEATVELNDNWVDAAGNFYFPLDIFVNNQEVELSGATNEEAVTSAVANAINKYSKTYEAGTNLSTVGTDSLAISWKWDYEGNDDVKDTFLGDQANNGNAGEITIGVKTTVTQVD